MMRTLCMSAVKRGIYTIHSDLVAKQVGNLLPNDLATLNNALRTWLDL